VAAEWWQPGATCHLSLDLPESFSAGDLWFDPLEVSCGLIVPVAGQEATSAHQPQRFDGWVSLEPVSPWQLYGAHLMDATLPSDLDIVTGEHAFRYCDLFSKLVADTFIWLPLRDTYGGDALARVWGEPHLEYGRGAATSGLVEVYSLDDLTRWRAGENFVPAETSELSPNGYRTPWREAVAESPFAQVVDASSSMVRGAALTVWAHSSTRCR
jgi:hypothetical protein